MAEISIKSNSIAEVGPMMRLVLRARGLWRDEEGSALLEGAIVVPFLFVLVLGTLEFSHIFYQQHLVATGVRDAARFLARTADPTVGAVQTVAQNLASTGSAAGGSVRRVTGFDPGHVSVAFTTVSNAIDPGTGDRPYREATPGCGGPNSILVINVTGSFTYTSLGLMGYFGFSAPTIAVTHSERCIGVS